MRIYLMNIDAKFHEYLHYDVIVACEIVVNGQISHGHVMGARIEAPKALRGVGIKEGVSPPQPTKGSGGTS